MLAASAVHASTATRGTLAQVRGGGGYIEHRGRGFPFSSGSRSPGDSEEVNQLVLHGDHGLGG